MCQSSSGLVIHFHISPLDRSICQLMAKLESKLESKLELKVTVAFTMVHAQGHKIE